MRTLALTPVLFAVAVAIASSGCAVIAAKAPDPERPRDQPPMCNDGKGGVVVDGLMTATLGISTLAIASEGEGGVAAVTGLAALAYGLSAGAGNSAANKCRLAQEEYLALQDRQETEEAFTRANHGPGGGGASGTLGGMPIAPDDEDKPIARAPQPQPQPQPQPRPQAQPQPQPVARPTPPSREPDGGGDEGDWSEFWKEVP